MNFLAFIASIVGSLAWPVAIVVLVYMLKSPLGKLLLDLNRLRYRDLELDFGREVRALETTAKNAGLQLPERKREEAPDAQQIITDASRLADEFPEPAVGLAWTAVEHELMHAVMRLGISADYPPYNAPVKNIGVLHKEGYLDNNTRELLDRMRNLRNAAVHPSRAGIRISGDEAREFVALTEAVVEKLKQLA